MQKLDVGGRQAMCIGSMHGVHGRDVQAWVLLARALCKAGDHAGGLHGRKGAMQLVGLVHALAGLVAYARPNGLC